MSSTEARPPAVPVGATEPTTLPTVTVIVPTFNRAASLATTLASLLAQDYPPDRLEVVVVDNSSTDATAQVVQTAQAQAPFALHAYRTANHGPAAARNYALARSSGEIVGFTDSDCRVPAGWVRAAVAQMGAGVGLVAGPIRPVWPSGPPLGFFQHQLAASAQENPLYPTANVFYRRAAIAQVGGFDEAFGAYAWGPPMGGEDTDLAWRVQRAGYRAAFAPAAPIDHEASAISIPTWLLDALRVQIFPRVLTRNPELRRYMLGRYFVGVGTVTFYLAVLGVVLGIRRSPFFFLLALPWAWTGWGAVNNDRWPPSRWWRIPVKYAFLVERSAMMAAALAYGSVRHRALAL